MRRNDSLRSAGIAGIVAVTCFIALAMSALLSRTSVDRSAKEFFAAAGASGVNRLGDAPASVALSSFAVWNSDALLVFGPQNETLASGYSGATYDTASGQWHNWPAWPYPDPVADPHVIWTGKEVVVLGTACTNKGQEGQLECVPGTLVAAEYVPATDAWTRIDVPTDANEGRAAGNDGQCCMTVGYVNNAALFQTNGKIYSWTPSSNSWSIATLPPASSAPSNYCSSDDAATAVDEKTVDVGNGVVHLSRSVTPITLRDGKNWVNSTSYEPDLASIDAVTAFCGGSTNLLALSADWQHVATWSASDGKWIDAPAPTVSLDRTYSGISDDQIRKVNTPVSFGFSAWTGAQYVWWNTAFVVRKPAVDLPGPEQVTLTANGVAFDPQLKTWSAVAAGPQSMPNGLAWRDGIGYGVTLDDGGSPAFISYTPSPSK